MNMKMSTTTKRYPPVKIRSARKLLEVIDDDLNSNECGTCGFSRSVFLRAVSYGEMLQMFGEPDQIVFGTKAPYRFWWLLRDATSEHRLAVRTIATSRGLSHVTTWDVWVEDSSVYDTLEKVFGSERFCD